MIPYFAPYVAYVGIASVFQNLIPIEINYVLRLIAVFALIVWAWRWYVPVTGPKSPAGSFVFGVGFGLLGLVLWCVLYAPFTEPVTTAWSTSGFYLRLIPLPWLSLFLKKWSCAAMSSGLPFNGTRSEETKPKAPF